MLQNLRPVSSRSFFPGSLTRLDTTLKSRNSSLDKKNSMRHFLLIYLPGFKLAEGSFG
jgi:hypothetical protein